MWSQIMDYGGYYNYVWTTVQVAIALMGCAALSYIITLCTYDGEIFSLHPIHNCCRFRQITLGIEEAWC
jgi:hypothetical protein